MGTDFFSREPDTDRGDRVVTHTLGHMEGQAASGKELRKVKNELTAALDSALDIKWVAMTTINGWNNYGPPYQGAQWVKDAFGFVHLRGRITGGTTASGTVCATGIPVGTNDEIFTIASGAVGASTELIVTGGTLVLLGVSAVSISLSGVTYFAP